MQIANFAEATRVLNGFIPRPLDVRKSYNLKMITALMHFLGDPQDELKVLHVAGTSGKTSTSYYIAALLQVAGQHIGLTVSPHIEQLSDRVQLDLQPLPEAVFCEALGAFIDEVAKSDLKPTYFELLIAFAYREFWRHQVDYAVVEVGLGGLLDGTNVVTRADKICIITDIGLDHTQVLGDTVAKIAAQKAGIIQLHNQVFMYEQEPEVMDVVRAVCAEKQATLHVVPTAVAAGLEFLPHYQQRNITLAQAAVNFALARDGQSALIPEQVQQAARVRIPGRMEVLHIGDKTVVLDGAHNPQKLRAMVESLQAEFPDKKIAALVGFVYTKEVALPENAQILQGVTHHVIASDFPFDQENVHRLIPADTVAAAFRQAGIAEVDTEPDMQKALELLLAAPESVLLVTGSLYLLAALRPELLLRAAPTDFKNI